MLTQMTRQILQPQAQFEKLAGRWEYKDSMDTLQGGAMRPAAERSQLRMPEVGGSTDQRILRQNTRSTFLPVDITMGQWQLRGRWRA